MEKKIRVNRIKCRKCGDVIESTSVHDFKFCLCGACAADGGIEYLKRVGEPEDWEELSEFDETESSRRFEPNRVLKVCTQPLYESAS